MNVDKNNKPVSDPEKLHILELSDTFDMIKEIEYHEYDHDKLYYCSANIYLPPLYGYLSSLS